jgi:hypothetical protein
MQGLVVEVRMDISGWKMELSICGKLKMNQKLKILP